MVIFTVPYSMVRSNQASILQSEVIVNIVIDTVDIDLSFFINLSKLNQSFIISLSDSFLKDQIIPDFLPQLYTIYTLSDCLLFNKRTILVISDSINTSIVNLEVIKSYFQAQGEENFYFINPQAGSEHSDCIQLIDIKKLELFNERTIEFYLEKPIEQFLITAQAPFVFQDQLSILHDLMNNNKYVRLAFELSELQRSKSYSAYSAHLWKERAKLYLSFISLSKQVGEGEYYEIKRWYHQEYEILPLWYKRVGHVLKAIKGKKDFKSLFKNN